MFVEIMSRRGDVVLIFCMGYEVLQEIVYLLCFLVNARWFLESFV